MFQILISLATTLTIAFNSVAGPKVPPPPPASLSQGVYFFTKSDNTIWAGKVNGTQTESVWNINIAGLGRSDSNEIAVGPSDLYYRWAPFLGSSNIYHVNPVTGKDKYVVTHSSSDAVAFNPVIGDRLYFEEITTDGPQVSSTDFLGFNYKVEVYNATNPRYYSELSFKSTNVNANPGIVLPYGVAGDSAQPLPDETGYLVRDYHTVFVYPYTGTGMPRFWPDEYLDAKIISPYHVAAAVTTDGHLVFLNLDMDWLPVGNPIPGPAMSGLTSVDVLVVP